MVIRHPCLPLLNSNQLLECQESVFLWIEVMCASCVGAKLYSSVRVLEHWGHLSNDVTSSKGSFCSQKKNFVLHSDWPESVKYARILMTYPQSRLQFTRVLACLAALLQCWGFYHIISMLTGKEILSCILCVRMAVMLWALQDVTQYCLFWSKQSLIRILFCSFRPLN